MNKSAVVIQATILVIVVAMSFQLWKLDTDLKVISSNQEQISPGTKRPMANGTRYALPPAIDTEIKNIEQQLGDSDKWPKDAESVRNLNERFVSAVDQLPPWAVDELGPRLLPRRWDIDALWLAKEATPVDVASLSDVAGTIAAHLEGKPQGVSEKIHKELLKRKDQIDKAERSAAIKSVRQVLGSNEAKTRDLEKAAESLSKYADSSDKEIGELNRQLGAIVLKRTVIEAFEALQKEFEGNEKIADTQLKEYALLQFNQGLMAVRLRVHSAGLADDADVKPKLAGLDQKVTLALAAARSLAQSRQAEKLKGYQVWALRQIKAVRTLDDLRPSEIAKISSPIDKNLPNSAARKAAEARAQDALIIDMVKLMAPINQSLLDEAVAQWFRKVYAKRFEELDELWKIALVERFATANKRPLE
jgi:hypothetical protein